MSVSSVTCPSCAAFLKSKTPLLAGKSIKCPKCATVFPIPAAPVPADAAKEAPAAPAKEPAPAKAAAKQATAAKEPSSPRVAARPVAKEAQEPVAGKAPAADKILAAVKSPAPETPGETLTTLTCTACSALLKPAKPVPVGKKVKCPKCGAAFTAAAPPPAPVEPFKLADDDSVTKPSEEPKKKPPADADGPITVNLVENEVSDAKPAADDAAEAFTDHGGGGRRKKKPISSTALALLGGASLLLVLAIGLLVLALAGFFDRAKPDKVAGTKPATTAATAPVKPTAALPVWAAPQPPPEGLDEEILVAGYGVRSLKDRLRIEEDNADESVSMMFRGPERKYQPYPALNINIGPEPPVMRGRPLEEAQPEVLKQINRELSEIAPSWSAAESGQVGGLSFVRTRLTGTLGGKKAVGFFYLGRDGTTSISFFAVDAGAQPEAAIALAEAVALSLRKDAGLARKIDPKEIQAVRTLKAQNVPIRLMRVNGVLQAALTGPQVTDTHLDQLAGLTALSQLDLNNTPITDAGLQRLKGLPNLKELYLNSTRITDAGLANLAGLEELTTLHLVGTSVTDAGMAHLTKLPKLVQVRVTGTKVTDAGAKKLQQARPGIGVVR